eukprot:CAMPEP_0170543128 /NCGR_PEP_ID=MMETSP0211-20121228/2348_1 /TAXON_ID=311385 /ORGANISM="Pseudokeronopsis sp., Strain OXSARD2" /LENGTH=55 /DNA_ID=CAMNT_0010846429 /DNA_START=110 /DNA_END=277 /DNA_ORIENTATION=+
MDPFVAFNYENKFFRTKTDHNGGRNPHWHEAFEIVARDLNHDIKFMIMDDKALVN